MKKVIIAILLIILGTYIISESGSKEYVSLNLKESLISEGIRPSFNQESNGEDEVKIYLFRGDGCSHCRDFLNFLNDVEEEYGDKYQLIAYEVWGNQKNDSLKKKVVENLNIKSTGVPLIIIGEEHFVGFAESYENKVLEAIDTEYEKEVKIDKVNEIINSKSNNNTLLYILIPILLIAIGYEIYKYLKAKKEEKIKLLKKEQRKLRKEQEKLKK